MGLGGKKVVAYGYSDEEELRREGLRSERVWLCRVG